MKTCLVTDEGFNHGTPYTFVHDGQEIKLCCKDWNVYLTHTLLGTIHAIWIEQAAVASGRWSYTDAMPTIPRLGVGIWPVLQLVVLTPFTVWLSSRCALRKRSRVPA